MFRSTIRLPFLITSSEVTWSGDPMQNVTYGMTLPISGILRVEDGALCFQYKHKKAYYLNKALRGVNHSLGGLLDGNSEKSETPEDEKPDIEDVCVPVSQIMNVVFKRARWFSSRLTLEANDLRAFEHLPGVMGGAKMRIRIQKQHADLAERFVSRLQLWLSERALRHLDDDLD